jgi:hypothetical protein
VHGGSGPTRSSDEASRGRTATRWEIRNRAKIKSAPGV